MMSLISAHPYVLEGIVVVLGLAFLVWDSFRPVRSKILFGGLAAITLMAVLVLLIMTPVEGMMQSHEMNYFYEFSKEAKFFKGFALLATAIVLLLSVDYRDVIERFSGDRRTQEKGLSSEYYSLPFFACAGMMWLASAKDFITLFVALELMTITFYVLVAYLRRNVGSIEAGVKYIILGALSTGLLVYGMAWIYGATGEMTLVGLQEALKSPDLNQTYLLFGVSFVVLAVAFKVGLVPMHVWIPDVYQGAPTPTTAFLSVASKAAGFGVIIRILTPLLDSPAVQKPVIMVFFFLGLATVVFANLAAIKQSNFKRLLAYSSISHTGFICLALVAWSKGSSESLSSKQVVMVYLATYLFMAMAAFFVLVTLFKGFKSDELSCFNGLGKRSPFLAFCLMVSLAAMVGLPLTSGFIGKLCVFNLLVEAQLWGVLSVAVLGALIGFYYYFKAIRAVYWLPASEEEAFVKPSLIGKTVILGCTIVTIVLGLYPMPLITLFS